MQLQLADKDDTDSVWFSGFQGKKKSRRWRRRERGKSRRRRWRRKERLDDSQSLYAGDDGVERSLDVGRGAGADDRQVVVLQHV